MSTKALERLGVTEGGRNNFWYRYGTVDAVIVFVHGVLSDSRNCWLYTDKQDEARAQYWPHLVAADGRFRDISIYMGGYHTAVDSGPYEIRNCADELFAALQRRDDDARVPPMEMEKITFVCHSMGGIVVRYLLETNYSHFCHMKVGLVLLASPSYGSKLANSLGNIAKIFQLEQGLHLRWGDWSLRDLDDRFRELREKKRIPNLHGLELYEQKFILHRKWVPFFRRTLVVEKESAGRYFGAPRQVPNSDHFDICKPREQTDLVHQYLFDFLASHDLLSGVAAGRMGLVETDDVSAVPERAEGVSDSESRVASTDQDSFRSQAEVRLRDTLVNGSPQRVVADIIDGSWGELELERVAANQKSARELLLGMNSLNSDTWCRMLFVDICARMTNSTEIILYMAFEDPKRHWAVKDVGLQALRFADGKVAEEAIVRLRTYARSEDMDVKRLAIAGLGFLGDFQQIKWIGEKEEVGKDDYSTEKLAEYIAFGCLDCFVYSANDRERGAILRTLEKTLDDMRKFNLAKLEPLNVSRRLSLIRPGITPELLRYVANSRHEDLRAGVLYALDGHASPYIREELYGVAVNPQNLAYADASLRALASIPGEESVRMIAKAVESRLPGAASTLLLAIGFSRAHGWAAHVRNCIGEGVGTEDERASALWAAGELAKDEANSFVPLLAESAQRARSGVLRGYACLGLAKAGHLFSKADLRVAAEHASEFVELILIGIAGLHCGHGEMIELGIEASQKNHAPLWRLQGHLYRDLRDGLMTGFGPSGRLLATLLSRGDLG